MYACGLCWALLSVLDLSSYALPAAVVAAGLTALLMAGSLTRLMRWISAGALAGGAGLWLALGGAGTVMEVLRGVTLHFSGVPAALPMVAQSAAMLLAFLCALTAWGLTLRSAGAYPSLAMLMMVLLLLWLSSHSEALIWLLPAVIAALTTIAFSAHEAISLRRVMPMMLAVALGGFLMIPTGGLVVQPMKDAADKLRQTIYDYFFFTEPRDVFSLALEGYYPQGQNQLGGKPNPSERPVMQVIASRRTYLRGVIKNEYTGRAWKDTTGGRRYLWTSLRWEESRERAFDQLLPSDMVNQGSGLMQQQTVAVRMLTDSASTMFVPQRIRALHPEGDLVPYFNNGSEVFATRNLMPGDTWAVQAPLVMAGDRGIADVLDICAEQDDPAYEQIRRDYTVLPSHLQQELYDLARRAVQGASTPYDMAYALQNYLSRHYRYTLDVADQPPEQDFVTTFLLQTKEGYCTYFASAMTVLCRMVGLPARYVEGYVALPDEEGRAVVTGKDGHAWTEVYFSGFGWLTFDATPWASGTADQQQNSDPDNPPPSQEPEDTPTPPPPSEEEQPEETPTPEPSQAPETTSSPEPTQEPDPTQSPPASGAPWLWWLLLLALAAAAGRIWWTLPRTCAARAKDDMARWLVWAQATHDALHALGLRRETGESPLAWMTRLTSTSALPQGLLVLGQIESLIFYGRLAPQEDDLRHTQQVYMELHAGMDRRRRLLMMLRRAFLPLKKRDFTKV